MPAPVTDREARLAAALRENLKRRKAQARARAEQPSDGRNPPEAANPPADAEADAAKDR